MAACNTAHIYHKHATTVLTASWVYSACYGRLQHSTYLPQTCDNRTHCQLGLLSMLWPPATQHISTTNMRQPYSLPAGFTQHAMAACNTAHIYHKHATTVLTASWVYSACYGRL